MAASLALSALRDKRAELSGQAFALEAQLARIRADFSALDATMRLLDSGAAPELIAPKRYHNPGPRLFRNKELPRLMFDVLRGANEALGSIDIARAVLAKRGLPDDAELLKRVENMCDGALRRWEGRGVKREWDGRALRWRVV